MKKISFCILLTAVLAWSIIPSWAQMGPGMMRGGACGPGMGAISPQQARALKTGPDIFNANCVGCHAGGGNSVMPSMPLRGSAHLKSFTAFRDFVRNPRLPSGARGAMPVFSSGQISNQQMQQLYKFVKSNWGS
jgi:mono/diheme cytochrome c family protein